jgi:hypothetical protein
MFCDIVTQQLVSLFMAAATDFLGLVWRIGNLKRGMDRMAGQTVRRFKLSQRAVIFMTFKAYWNASMFPGMTGGAFLFRVFAGLSLQAGGYLAMAQLTPVFQFGRVRDGDQRLVRIGMAVKTLQDSFGRTMRGIVATGTFWHDLRIVVTQRIIGMKNFMAIGAGHGLVPGAVIFDPVELGGMATGAISQGERCDLDGFI